MQQGIAALRTVHSNKLKGCALLNDKVMWQKDRFSSEVKTCKSNDMSFVLLDGLIIMLEPFLQHMKPSNPLSKWKEGIKKIDKKSK